MRIQTIAINQQLIKGVSILALLLFWVTTVHAKESIKFINELKADMKMPVDVALAPNKDIYVLDQKIPQVFVFNPAGKIMFSFGRSGSGMGELSNPQSLAISRNGDVVIADTGNKRVQVFNARGNFMYELGNSGSEPGQFSEPALVATDAYGYILVADTSNKSISKFSPKGVFFQSIPLEGSPTDMVFDIQQNLYMFYPEMGKIVKWPMEGKMESIEFAWEGRNYVADAARISVDMRGDIYLIDQLKNSVVKIDQKRKILLSFGSKGTGRGQFDQPLGMVTDDQGNIYIADTKNRRVQMIEVLGSEKTALVPVEGKAPVVDYAQSISAQKSLSDIEYDEKYGLFALSEVSGLILHQRKNSLGIYGDPNEKVVKMQAPMAMQILNDGKMLVADTGNNRLQFLNANGSHDYLFGTKGMDNGQFDSLSGVAVNREGQIYVADTKNNRIQIFNSDGIYLKSFGQKGEMDGNNKLPRLGYFNNPKTLEFDSKGLLYVLDTKNKRIQVFDQEGIALKEIGTARDTGKFIDPVDLAIDEWDNLYVADRGSHTVKVLNNQGKPITEFGSDGKGPSYFPKLSSISAAKGKIYIADYDTDEIKVFDIHINDKLMDTKMVMKNEEKAPAKAMVSKANNAAPKKSKLMISANTVSADEIAVVDQMVKSEQPVVSEQPNVFQRPKIIENNGVKHTSDRVYFTQVSYPLKTENANEKIKVEMVYKMTLQLAIVNISTKYGMDVKAVTPHIKVEKEDILEDGRLRITVSVPKDLSNMKQSTQADMDTEIKEL
ncbi:MAG: hypothetical protein KBD53_01990 [Candidatus Omnitrophica bacterium]|nr:hypothetical protein [Candidatus Omnitrophota bacterium]